jgi:hypothetical protein
LFIVFILPDAQAHATILDNGNLSHQKSSPITPLLPPVSVAEVSQLFEFEITLLQHPQQTSSLHPGVDQSGKIHIADYMLSNPSGLLQTSSSPVQYSSTMTAPNISPLASTSATIKDNKTPLFDITSPSDMHQRHSSALPTHNLPSYKENHLLSAPACSIGPIQDTVLIALTEPFLMAWCQDVNQASHALECL